MDSNGWLSPPLSKVSAEDARDVERLRAIVDNQTAEIKPGMVFPLAGQPFVIVRQLTRQEFENRVIECGVDAVWLNAPADVLFWEVSTG